MFLASDRIQHRESKVRRYLRSDPGVALLLGAVNFEWTVRRAILFLAVTPNATLREKMVKCYSLEAYKDLWNKEVSDTREVASLPKVVRNWSNVCKAFNARNRLVHAADRYTTNMATPHVEALLKGVAYIDAFCESLGSSLHLKMPVRRKRRVAASGCS